MISEIKLKIILSLIISLFLFQTGIAQLSNSPRNNCFTDVERDSILSKLLAKEYFEEQYHLSLQALEEADKVIFYLKQKDTTNQIIIKNQNKNFQYFTDQKNKETKKEKITLAAIGFLAGAFLVALIL